jgi:uracil-DNA glycosylase
MTFPQVWLDFAGLRLSDIPDVPEPAYPPVECRYRALTGMAPEQVKVVILGQDPYHGAGEADGLAFSVPQGCRIPPSLRHIFQELTDDLGGQPPMTSDLGCWAQQGVLLLNTALSVAPDQPASHTKLGWHVVTDALIKALGGVERQSRGGARRVFVLWGKHAQAREGLIDKRAGHLVLTSPHPSPFSARKGFFGSKPFSRVNEWLISQGDQPIRWS